MSIPVEYSFTKETVPLLVKLISEHAAAALLCGSS
jgi:hypothetical protein